MPYDLGPPPALLAAWIPVISAFGVTLIGIAASVVAFLQWRLAHNKLRLDLYDRRFPVFQMCRETCRRIIAKHPLTDEELDQFEKVTSQGVLLFGDDINSIISSLSELAWTGEVNGSADGNPAFRLARAIDNRFPPYLRIDARDRSHDRKGTGWWWTGAPWNAVERRLRRDVSNGATPDEMLDGTSEFRSDH